MNLPVLSKGLFKGLSNILLKLIAALLVLAFVVIAVFIGINLKDQPPSAAAIEFQQAWGNRLPVPERDNGYIYLLGFDAEQTSEPVAVGLERIRWASEVVKSASTENLDYPQPRYYLQQSLPATIKKSFDLCKQINDGCVESIEKHAAEIVAGSSEKQRYHKLIAHAAWLELSVLDIRLGLLSAVAKIRHPEGDISTASLYKKLPFVVDETHRSILVSGYGNSPQGQHVFFY